MDDPCEIATPLKRSRNSPAGPPKGGRRPSKKPRVMPPKAKGARVPSKTSGLATPINNDTAKVEIVKEPASDLPILTSKINTSDAITMKDSDGVLSQETKLPTPLACGECNSSDLVEDRIDPTCEDLRFCAKCWESFDVTKPSTKLNADMLDRKDSISLTTIDPEEKIAENCSCGLVPCQCVVEDDSDDYESDSDEGPPCSCMMIPCICTEEELAMDRSQMPAARKRSSSGLETDGKPRRRKNSSASSSSSRKNSISRRNGLLLSKEGEPEVHLVPSLSRVLKPHQVKGVKFMWGHVSASLEDSGEGQQHGCVLADSMGLGKTLQLISVIVTFLKTFRQGGNGKK